MGLNHPAPIPPDPQGVETVGTVALGTGRRPRAGTHGRLGVQNGGRFVRLRNPLSHKAEALYSPGSAPLLVGRYAACGIESRVREVDPLGIPPAVNVAGWEGPASLRMSVLFKTRGGVQ
jgi:hypothetical protein